MRLLSLALALLLPGLALAQGRGVQPISLHPVLVGSLAQAANPLVPQLASGLKLAASAPAPSSVLLPLAEAGPSGRLVASALATALVEPRAAEALVAARPELASTLASARLAAAGDPLVAQLAHAAKDDAAVAALFDGGAAPSLELDGLNVKRGRLRDGKRKAERLGVGGFGAVDEHPRVPGAVVKTVEVAVDNLLFSDPAELRRMLAAEEPTARALGEAGAGPRFFGSDRVSRRSVSVRERVYGESLDRLMRDRRFTAEDEGLVLEMLDRMAAAGLMVDDMHPRNIMLGTTLADPVRRAYLVDGGRVLEVPAGTAPAELRRELENQEILVSSRWIPQLGITIETKKPFRTLLDEGLARAKRTSRWQRFWDAVKEAYANAPIGMK